MHKEVNIMPRVSLNKDKYLLDDLCGYIRQQLKTQRIRQQELAQELGITQPALSIKLDKGTFYWREILVIFRVLETPSEKRLQLLGGIR